jgi:hypothetical protein
MRLAGTFVSVPGAVPTGAVPTMLVHCTVLCDRAVRTRLIIYA